jgi:hypothetical protein
VGPVAVLGRGEAGQVVQVLKVLDSVLSGGNGRVVAGRDLRQLGGRVRKTGRARRKLTFRFSPRIRLMTASTASTASACDTPGLDRAVSEVCACWNSRSMWRWLLRKFFFNRSKPVRSSYHPAPQKGDTSTRDGTDRLLQQHHVVRNQRGPFHYGRRSSDLKGRTKIVGLAPIETGIHADTITTKFAPVWPSSVTAGAKYLRPNSITLVCPNSRSARYHTSCPRISRSHRLHRTYYRSSRLGTLMPSQTTGMIIRNRRTVCYFALRVSESTEFEPSRGGEASGPA